jgi:hypothetical protein
MAALLTTHLPIIVVSTVSGNQEAIQNYPEAASQTFKGGSVVELNGSGNVIAWDGTTTGGSAGPGIILGVALVGGFNYATAGAGASPLYGSIGFPGGTPTFGTVPNQPSAVNLVHGALFATGLTIVAQSVNDTIFEAQTDASSGAVFNPTVALVGTALGMTVDGNGFWYVDLAKSTFGTNTVVEIMSLNPQDLVSGSTTTSINNGRVRFKFLRTASSVG